MKKKREQILDNLKKLEDIVSWFEDQEDVDLEVGLVKAREGAELIKVLRERIKEARNEFLEVQKELEAEEEAS